MLYKSYMAMPYKYTLKCQVLNFDFMFEIMNMARTWNVMFN